MKALPKPNLINVNSTKYSY